MQALSQLSYRPEYSHSIGGNAAVRPCLLVSARKLAGEFGLSHSPWMLRACTFRPLSEAMTYYSRSPYLNIEIVQSILPARE